MTNGYPSFFICQIFLRNYEVSICIFKEEIPVYLLRMIKLKVLLKNYFKNIVDSYEMFFSIGNFVIVKNHCKTFIAKIIIRHFKALETQFHKFLYQILISKCYLGFENHFCLA